jgi:membrane-associated protease RseP (regulator of RpoE activity)
MSIRSTVLGPSLLVAMALGVNAPTGLPLPTIEPSAWARPPEGQPAQGQPSDDERPSQQRIRPNPNAGFLGAKFGPISDELAEQLKLDSQAGLLVMEVIPDSPAAKAQLQENDIIRTIDGKPIEDVRAFVMMMNETKPEQVMKLGILREGKPTDVSVTLGKRPPMMNQMDRGGPATAPTTRPGE